MKQIILIILILPFIMAGCQKTGNQQSTSGTSRIDNTLYGAGPYYAYGFCVTTGLSISTEPDPVDVITINTDVSIDGSIIMIYFSTNNFDNSFFLFGQYADATSAVNAFKALKSFSDPQWTATGDQVMANQIWLYKTSKNTYAKLRIISTTAGKKNNIPYGACEFEWVYQSNGTLTFNAK
jgi:hypothetical protein